MPLLVEWAIISVGDQLRFIVRPVHTLGPHLPSPRATSVLSLTDCTPTLFRSRQKGQQVLVAEPARDAIEVGFETRRRHHAEI